MGRQFLASGNQEFQEYTDSKLFSIADPVNQGWSSSVRGRVGDGDGEGLLFTGGPRSPGFQGLVQFFAGAAGALNGLFAEGEAAGHGDSLVTPRGATMVLRPAGTKANTFP